MTIASVTEEIHDELIWDQGAIFIDSSSGINGLAPWD
jgi:hypothetical protein